MTKSEIIQISVSCAGVFISLIALWISNWQNRRNKKIKKVNFYLNNFLTIYQYLYKNESFLVPESEWQRKNDMFLKMNKGLILQHSILHLYPNIFMNDVNISFLELLKNNKNNFTNTMIKINEIKFVSLLDKSITNLIHRLENSTNAQIRKSLIFWKSMYKKINKIQKSLIRNNIIKIENNRLIINQSSNKKLRGFWIEVNPNFDYDFFNQYSKSIILKFVIYFKKKLVNSKRKSFWKSIILQNWIKPFIYRKSKFFILHEITENDNEILMKFWGRKRFKHGDETP